MGMGRFMTLKAVWPTGLVYQRTNAGALCKEGAQWGALTQDMCHVQANAGIDHRE